MFSESSAGSGRCLTIRGGVTFTAGGLAIEGYAGTAC